MALKLQMVPSEIGLRKRVFLLHTFNLASLSKMLTSNASTGLSDTNGYPRTSGSNWTKPKTMQPSRSVSTSTNNQIWPGAESHQNSGWPCRLNAASAFFKKGAITVSPVVIDQMSKDAAYSAATRIRLKEG
jgi:hypothetical protein